MTLHGHILGPSRTVEAINRPQSADTVPAVALSGLDIVWINTGTLCNLSCTNCFMDSTPTNDALAYFSLTAFLDLLETAPPELREIGFTGGEPFMNPDIIALLEAALAAGKTVLVLTNAMRPMQRHATALPHLLAAWPGRLALRVSIDHFEPAKHDALRGTGSFSATLAGLKFLANANAPLTVAARTPWDETRAFMRGGFARLFAEHGVKLNADDPASLVLFPEMDVAAPFRPVTPQALANLPAPPMCATSRMVVQRKGEAGISVTPCTLLPHRDLGPSLTAASGPVTLNHPHCAQFCVYGGASCAGSQT